MMKEGTQLIQQLDSGLNSMIYVFSGNVTIPRETSVRTHPQIFGLESNNQSMMVN